MRTPRTSRAKPRPHVAPRTCSCRAPTADPRPRSANNRCQTQIVHDDPLRTATFVHAAWGVCANRRKKIPGSVRSLDADEEGVGFEAGVGAGAAGRDAEV